MIENFSEQELKLKSQLMKLEKEVLVNYLVRVNNYSGVFWESLLEDLSELSKMRSQSRKINRVLKQLEDGTLGKKRKIIRRKRDYDK